MEKQRFLDNLWDVQARYRTKNNQSVALCADDVQVEKTSYGKVTHARTYFNVYQRTAFLQEPKKVCVVIYRNHVTLMFALLDQSGHAH